MVLKSECVIQKLFPYDKFPYGMKLTKGKLIETIRRKNQGWTTSSEQWEGREVL